MHDPQDIASVHIALGMKGDDLLDLPEWMHGHASVGLRNIGLPENQAEIRLQLSKIAKGIA